MQNRRKKRDVAADSRIKSLQGSINPSLASYCTVHLLLESSQIRPLCSLLQSVSSTCLDLGITTLDHVCAQARKGFDTASNGYSSVSKHGTRSILRKYVDVRTIDMCVNTIQEPNYVQKIEVSTLRPRSKKLFSDTLFAATYLEAMYDESLRFSSYRVPTLTVVMSLDLINTSRLTVPIVVDKLLDAIVSKYAVCDGVVDLTWGIEACDDRYYTQSVLCPGSMDRITEYAKWMSPDIDPLQRLPRVAWGTLLGRRLMERIGLRGEIIEAYCRATVPWRTPDTSYGHWAKVLREGSTVFYVTPEIELFLGTQPNGMIFDEATQAILYPLVWLHQQLRKRDMIT